VRSQFIAHSAPIMPAEPPVKRLRLGTKSCAECRRRKVRCIFKPGETACEGCTIHEVVCSPQKGAPKQSVEPSPPESDASHGETEVLYNRIAQLESLMAQMLKNPPGDNVPVSMRLSSLALPADTRDEGGRLKVLNGEGDADLCKAPLSAFLEDAAPLTSDGRKYTSTVRPIRQFMYVPQPPLPSLPQLATLFEYSEKIWFTWPSCTFGSTQSAKLIPNRQNHNISLVFDTLQSNDHVMVAKVYLWVSLCLMHYPRDRIQELQLQHSYRQLLDQYTAYAAAALSFYNDTSVTISILESMSLQWRFYFNSGKPQKAWHILRRAIASAIQLGLHQPHGYEDKSKIMLWDSFWQSERLISCILGLPSCTSNEHPGTRPNDGPNYQNNPIAQAHFKLGIITGDIIKRDHTELKNNYAATHQIDQDLEEVQALLPSINTDVHEDQSFTTLYQPLMTHVRYWMMLKLAHMPYMLKAMHSSRYQHSFDRARKASRKIIELMSTVRALCTEYMCETLDFQLFSAAVVLLLADHHRLETNASTRQADWSLISIASQCLRQTNIKLDCAVAKQGADALDIIIAACRGQYAFQEDFVVTIPYFGRVRLKNPSSQPVPTQISTTTSSSIDNSSSMSTHQSDNSSLNILQSTANQLFEQPVIYPNIEFSGYEFNSVVPTSFAFGDELGADWFHFTANEIGYDWVQEYQCSSYPAPGQ